MANLRAQRVILRAFLEWAATPSTQESRQLLEQKPELVSLAVINLLEDLLRQHKDQATLAKKLLFLRACNKIGIHATYEIHDPYA